VSWSAGITTVELVFRSLDEMATWVILRALCALKTREEVSEVISRVMIASPEKEGGEERRSVFTAIS
jgi:hypothetical protein